MPTRLASISVTPVVEATPDYADGDVIGGKMSLAGIGKNLSAGGTILSAHCISLVDIAALVPIRLIIFNADPGASTFTENSAFAVHADDVGKIAGVINLDQRLDLGTPVMLYASPFVLPVIPRGTGAFAVAVAGGAVNLAGVADLTFVFGIEQR